MNKQNRNHQRPSEEPATSNTPVLLMILTILIGISALLNHRVEADMQSTMSSGLSVREVGVYSDKGLEELTKRLSDSTVQMTETEEQIFRTALLEGTMRVNQNIDAMMACIKAGTCQASDQYLTDLSHLYEVIEDGVHSLRRAPAHHISTVAPALYTNVRSEAAINGGRL